MTKVLFPGVGPNKVVYFFGGGLLLITIAIYTGFAGFPLVISKKIKNAISLKEESESLKHFKELPVPLEFNVYIFNVTNPEEVSQGARPELKQVGPYVYDEYKKKVNFSMPQYMYYVTYKEVKTYKFNPNKSDNLRESDEVTVLNIPLMGSAYMVEERFPMGLAFLNAAVPYLFPNATIPFIQTTVGGLLFDGVPIRCGYKTGPAMPICRGMATNLPPPIRRLEGTEDFAFSMFHNINGSESGLFKVNRGTSDLYKLGSIIQYKNLDHLDMWERNSSCSKLRGTDASILPPIRDHEDLYLYLPEVCLSLRAVYSEDAEVSGVPVYLYKSSQDNFASPDEVKENICRCKKVEDKPEPVCLKKGAIDASKCQGASVILTQPHFYNCDPEYSSYPVGLQPDPKLHETRVFIHPQTGVPLAAYKRIQMNIFLKRFEEIDMLKNVSEGLFPLIWVEEALPKEMLKIYLPSLKELILVERVSKILVWLCGAVGLACVCWSVFLYLKHQGKPCLRENQVVSNPAEGRLDNEKRTVYNIPITPLQTEGELCSSDAMYLKDNATFKRTLTS
nr:sensory neuron membrane protein [Tropidothorax elegans]